PVREHILHYSREVAFALADVYARAAEMRGAMDSRLESVLLDAVLRGQDPDEIRHRATALGWRGDHDVMVMAGLAPGQDKPVFIPDLRRAAARLDCVGPVVDSLISAHVSARHTLAGLSAAAAHPRACRPTPAEDLLPERALL
ncbi:PucR family transcriptional regulator, partial [Xanthomonas citri pv. citri]|nr:PucR family transcriptional regulator [Xanthomonas citri pv. citri]